MKCANVFVGAERREVAKTLDDGRQLFKHVVDFGFGRVAAEREAHRAVDRGEGNAHRAYDMARVERAGRARGAGRNADPYVAKAVGDRLAFDVLERDVERVRKAVRLVAVYADIRAGREDPRLELVS